MPTNVVTAMRLEKFEPSSIVVEALNDELWTLIKLDTNPPSIVFKEFLGNFSGQCMDLFDTTSGELELHSELQSTTRTFSSPQAKENLCSVYLHELAHRLTGHRHVAVFSTFDFCLRIRARKLYPYLWQRVSLYDFQEHVESDIDMADAFTFIYRIGIELAQSDLNTTQLVSEIEARWKIYRQEVLSRPQRQNSQRDHIMSLQTQISQIKADRFLHAGYGLLAGLVAVLAAQALARAL